MGKLKNGKTKGRCRKIFLTVWLSVAVAVVSLWGSMLPADAAGPDITSPSAMVIEASTGQVIYEKNAEEVDLLFLEAD